MKVNGTSNQNWLNWLIVGRLKVTLWDGQHLVPNLGPSLLGPEEISEVGPFIPWFIKEKISLSFECWSCEFQP